MSVGPPFPNQARRAERGCIGGGAAHALAVAEEELAAQPEFPVVVVNDRLEEAIDELTRVVREGIDEARDASPAAGR